MSATSFEENIVLLQLYGNTITRYECKNKTTIQQQYLTQQVKTVFRACEWY